MVELGVAARHFRIPVAGAAQHAAVLVGRQSAIQLRHERVPLLAAFLFWKRWICRPEKSPLRSARAVGILYGTLAFSLLFIRFVRAVDPQNPYAIWIFALAVTGLSLCAVYFAGGSSWVRHFAFPVLFVLVAVPWVYAFEQFVVQNLMRIVASITVEALDWLGIAAIQHGNVIEINAGLMGIDEACSGVRSMQSTLMVSLFLGEHFRFPPLKRIILVVASILLAFSFNVFRALILVLIAVRSGMEALSQWHDRAGFSILAACFVGLYGLSWIMRSRQREEIKPDSTVQLYALPRGFVGGLLLWLLLLNPLKNAWIEHYQPEIVDNTRWTIQWPESNTTFNLSSLNDDTMFLLRCTRGDSANWKTSDGYVWQAFFIRWEPGSGSAEGVSPYSRYLSSCIRVENAAGYWCANGQRG